jgi:hypothetical protein
MSIAHMVVLYASLVVLGLSLLIPGIMGVVRRGTGTPGLMAATVDAANHVRALNGMMAAIGGDANRAGDRILSRSSAGDRDQGLHRAARRQTLAFKTLRQTSQLEPLNHG